MKVDNRASFDVILKWMEGSIEKTLTVLANGIQDFHCKIRSKRRPKSIVVKAFIVSSSERVLLNDRNDVSIRPARYSTNRVFISIEGKGATDFVMFVIWYTLLYKDRITQT